MTEAAFEVDWDRLPDMPVAKWEPASLVLDDKLYVLGGYEDGIMSSRILHVFDPAQGTWTRLQDMPSAISHVNLVPGNSGFWFAGGMKDKIHPAKDHIIAEVWHFDPEFDRYTAAPLLPGRRAGGGLARVADRMHYISGLMEDRDTDSPDHWVFDLAVWEATGAAQWEPAAPLPTPRNQLSVAVLNDKIYAIGGQLGHDKQQIDQVRVDIYDPVSDTWSDGPPLPYGHSHSEGATFAHNERIWMLGGHTTPDGGKKGFCGNVLTLRNGEDWQLTCLLPKPISSPAARIIHDRLYVAGGWDGRMDENKTWLSSPEVWTTEVPATA
jgi:N-acetylneuraminic acid mutarotase